LYQRHGEGGSPPLRRARIDDWAARLGCVICRQVVWGLPCSASIKEVVLGFFPRQDEIDWMLAPLIWPDGRVPEDSASELHWAIHAWRLMDRVILGRAHPCFFLTVWVQREHSKLSAGC
jgi:hypothetical protein